MRIRRDKSAIAVLSIALLISLATTVNIVGTRMASTTGTGMASAGLFADAYADTQQCENTEITKITASAGSTRSPENAIDNNLATRWTDEGKGSWIKPDLGGNEVVCYVDITWYKGSSRTYSFTIYTSEDGREWNTVYRGKSSGKTLDAERYDFADTTARWIKIRVDGNQWNNWNDITEIDVYSHTLPADKVADTKAPYVEITNPASNSVITSASSQITVQGTASDSDSGVKLVEVRANDGAYIMATPSASGDWSSWTATLPVTSSDTRITSRAKDNAGNQGESSISISVVDNAPNTKYFMATMLQYVDTDKQVNIYKPNMISSDKARIHVGLNKQVTSEQLDGLLSLPGDHGMEFFSLAEIKANAPLLKAKGIEFIDYDLEPGSGYSPASDLADPVASIRAASKAAHDNGLLFQCSPSKKITTDYGAQLAPYCDQYHIQAQSLQTNPAQYESFVKSTVAKLRQNNPDIVISVQLSTQRGAASGMTLLETMKNDFARVADDVDGITLWFANNDSALSAVKSFAEWFDANYH